MKTNPKSRIDTTLINTLSALAKKERRIKEFRRRVRIKGKIVQKGKTKKGNIRLIVQKGKDEYKFIVIKSHKEKYKLTNKLIVGDYVAIAGISRLRAIICTQLKQIKNIDESRQSTLL